MAACLCCDCVQRENEPKLFNIRSLLMIKPGDVFEIHTAKGVAYFQFVKKIPPMGSLIRILPGTHDGKFVDRCILAEQETNFWIFFPVATALKRKLVRKVDYCDIPLHARKTPIFRSGWWIRKAAKLKIGGYGMAKRSGGLEPSRRNSEKCQSLPLGTIRCSSNG